MKHHQGVAVVFSSVIGLLAVALLLAGRAAAAPAPPAIITGQDAGWPDVRGWDRFGNQAQAWAPWGEFPLGFAPYPTYQNGVRVAVGDVNGDGRNEIVTAPGKDAFTELRVFDGRTFRQVGSLLPFKDASWWAGAYIATGDTNGDGRDEIVEGLDASCCTTLHVLDGVTGQDSDGFFPYGDQSQVGARVAAGDINGDGKAEILAAPIGSARISAYAADGGTTSFRSFDSFGPELDGPISFAAGDLVGDARAELVVAAPTSSGAQVRVIDAATGTTKASFAPYGTAAVSAVEVAVADFDGDGRSDIVLSAETPDGTEVKALDMTGTVLDSFFVLDPSIVPGASLAAGDLDGDGKAEIVLGAGAAAAPWPPVANGRDQRVDVFHADGTPVGSFVAYPGVFQGGVRVASADLDGDRRPEIVTAPGPGMESEIGVFTQQWVESRDRGTRLAHFLAFEPGFTGGVDVAAGDVDGNGTNEIVAASGPGRTGEVRVFDAQGRQVSSLVPFGDDYRGGLSVAVGDLNADGVAEIVVGTLAAPARIRVFSRGVQLGPTMSPLVPDAGGVEVAVADFAGDGFGRIVAASASGSQPRIAVVDPTSGVVERSFEPSTAAQNGLRIAAGDLDGDGRDELIVSSAWGGDGSVQVLDGNGVRRSSFLAYPYPGWGENVAVRPRIGLPIAAFPRTVRMTARKRTRVIVARFRDAQQGSGGFRAVIEWGDGTLWNGVVQSRGGGVFDVRSLKRYARAGRYALTVTLTDGRGRSSIARGTTIVRRGR